MTFVCTSCEPEVRTRKRDERCCFECGAAICASHVWTRVDESNASITQHSPSYCGTCAEKLEPRWLSR